MYSFLSFYSFLSQTLNNEDKNEIINNDIYNFHYKQFNSNNESTIIQWMETHHFDEALLASTIYTPQKKLNEYDINQQNQSIHTHQKKKKKIEKGNDLHQQ